MNIRILIGLFFIAHGLVHSGLAVAPIPNDPVSKPFAFFTAPTRSWLLSNMGMSESVIRNVGLILVALATLTFVMAGLGVLGVPGLYAIWRTVTVVSAIPSLLLLGVFWHPWLVIGAALDLGILISLLWAHWPPQSMLDS